MKKSSKIIWSLVGVLVIIAAIHWIYMKATGSDAVTPSAQTTER